MSDSNAPEGSLAHHLSELAATAEDLKAFLSQPHDGDVHPEALANSERLSASLRDVIHALTHHEHLAMSTDDVWKTLTQKHNDHGDGSIVS